MVWPDIYLIAAILTICAAIMVIYTNYCDDKYKQKKLEYINSKHKLKFDKTNKKDMWFVNEAKVRDGMEFQDEYDKNGPTGNSIYLS